MDYYYYDGELYHHGVAGQKWGVQNGPPYPLDSGVSKSNAKRKFDTGKLTSKVKSAAGSVKNKVSSKVSSSRAKSKETKENSRLKKLDISKMTNEELKAATDRLNLESNYNSAYNRANSSNTSKGKQFVKYAGSIVSSSLKTVATEQITKGLRSILNNDPNADLKKETEKLKMESQKSTYENNIATNNEKAESRASSSATKAAADFASSANKTAKSFRDATVETAKGSSKAASSSFASTKKIDAAGFTTTLTSSEYAQINEMRNKPYSEVSSSRYTSEGKNYIDVVDFEDLYKKKK